MNELEYSCNVGHQSNVLNILNKTRFSVTDFFTHGTGGSSFIGLYSTNRPIRVDAVRGVKVIALFVRKTLLYNCESRDVRNG